MNETAQELRAQAAVLIARSVALDRSQLSRADLEDMTSDQIMTARDEGRFDVILGIPSTQVALLERARNGIIDVADVDSLTEIHREDLIEAARVDGRITMAKIQKENH